MWGLTPEPPNQESHVLTEPARCPTQFKTLKVHCPGLSEDKVAQGIKNLQKVHLSTKNSSSSLDVCRAAGSLLCRLYPVTTPILVHPTWECHRGACDLLNRPPLALGLSSVLSWVLTPRLASEMSCVHMAPDSPRLAGAAPQLWAHPGMSQRLRASPQPPGSQG